MQKEAWTGKGEGEKERECGREKQMGKEKNNDRTRYRHYSCQISATHHVSSICFVRLPTSSRFGKNAIRSKLFCCAFDGFQV